MDVSDIRQKSDEELKTEVLALRREQFNLRMQAGAGQAARPDRFGKIRKDIARIKTVQNERRSTRVS